MTHSEILNAAFSKLDAIDTTDADFESSYVVDADFDAYDDIEELIGTQH